MFPDGVGKRGSFGLALQGESDTGQRTTARAPGRVSAAPVSID